MADISLNQRPQVGSTSKPVGYDAAARTVDQGSTIQRAVDPDLQGLVTGLQSFNPALAKFSQTAEVRQHAEESAAQTAGHAAAERAKGGFPIDQSPPPDAGFAGTFQSIYEGAYRQGIVERGADAARSQTVAEFNDAKNLPGFDIDQFIAQHRAANMQGLDDPMAIAMGTHLDKLENSLRQDWDGIRLKRLDEVRESNISASLRNQVTADDPGAAVRTYREQVLPVIEGMGKTKKEGAQYLLRHLINLSDKNRGLPELFDSLVTDKDAAGMTVFDANPELQTHIQRARHAAMEQRDREVHDSAQDGNLHQLKQMDEQLAKDPHSFEFERDISANIGKNSVFTSNAEGLAYWNKILRAQGDTDQQNNLLRLAAGGQLFMADEKDQKAVMKSLTGSVVSGLSDSISRNDVGAVAGLSGALIDAHRAAGSNVPSEPIKQMFQYIGQAAPGKDGQRTALFSSAAEVYRALEAKPELRNAYFDEDGRKVMAAYTQAVAGGAEPTEAYKSAYAAVSPEAKAREEAFRKTPEFQEKLQKATKWVTGSSFWPQILGGNGRPDNGGTVVAAAQEFALNFVRRNPNATDDDVQNATKAHIAESMVLDGNTHVAVSVPPGASPEVTQQAVTAYTGKLIEQNHIKDRDAGWGITMIPSNINQGTYRVATSFNGSAVHFIEEVKMSDMVAQHRKDTMFLPEDAAVLKNAQVAMASGTAYNDPKLAMVVAKARQLGVQPDVVKQIEAQQVKHAKDTLSSLPRTDFAVDTANLYRNDRIQLSPKITTDTSQRFLNSSNGGSTGLAASLITQGEGVVYRAYDDPAQGAGKNIGTGYNLKANKDNAPRDLRMAGVPAERIPGIIDGSQSLSPEQSDRLTLLAVGRYETLAQSQVDGVQKGLWTRLQPQQRAVLTDIAYQTGDVGQFKKAIGSLVAGDVPGFQAASKVYYTNRQGVKVEDVRRNALRNAMLSGTSYWQSVLMRSGSQPSNQIDAVKVANQP